MRKAIITALVLGLLAGSMALPAEAKKKKKKKPPVVALAPTELKFFLHWDDDGAGGCTGAQYMDLTDKEGDTGCSFTFQPAQEAFIASGAQDPLAYVWPATEGVPFTLDASRKIVIEWAMRANFAVNASVEVKIEGTAGGELKEIAAGQSSTFNAALTGQTGPVALKLELDPNADLDKLTFDTLQLTSTIRGVCSCYEGRENPGSFLVMPAFQ
jgi:hypothetical protein